MNILRFIPLCILLMALIIPAAVSYASEGHSQRAVAVTNVTVVSTPSSRQLEQLVALLKELLVLLQQQKGTMHVSGQAHTLSAQPSNMLDITHSSSTNAHHSTSTVATTTMVTSTVNTVPPKVFAIEVEEHDGNTHVHVRYVDKPEEMFFVNAPMTNEPALLIDIMNKTLLPKSVIKPALVYFR